jgi:hypothetical protein
MPRTHLFLGVTGPAFGELNLGLRIAWELHARGERCLFLAPSLAAVLFDETPFHFLAIDSLLPMLEEALPALLAREGCATIVLVDLASVFITLDTVWSCDASFLTRLGLPVVAFDYWNLGETNLRWDYGSDAITIAEKALELPRLVPVPIARPTSGPGGYNALPSGAPVPAAEAEAVRTELGFSPRDKLVLLLSNKSQQPEMQMWKHHGRLARLLPRLMAEALASLDDVRVLHVGPAAFDGVSALGDRYLWHRQVSANRFGALLSTVDLLLSFNTTASTTISAVASGLPVVVGMNSHAGRTVAEVEAACRFDVVPGVAHWLGEVVPLHRFRIWPLGLYELLSPVLADNPYMTTLRTVEILDWHGLVGACAELLFDPHARDAQRERQAAYCAAIRTLPSAADVFLSYL